MCELLDDLIAQFLAFLCGGCVEQNVPGGAPSSKTKPGQNQGTDIATLKAELESRILTGEQKSSMNLTVSNIELA